VHYIISSARASRLSVKYIPAWFPGAGFKKKALKWRKLARDMIDRPYDMVKAQFVHPFHVITRPSYLLGHVGHRGAHCVLCINMFGSERSRRFVRRIKRFEREFDQKHGCGRICCRYERSTCLATCLPVRLGVDTVRYLYLILARAGTDLFSPDRFHTDGLHSCHVSASGYSNSCTNRD